MVPFPLFSFPDALVPYTPQRPPFMACRRRTFSVMRVSADLISPFSKESTS